jgi:hypothetical protein
MRFAPSRLAVGIFALTLAVAGCGGSTITVQEVPGEPAQLTVPGNGAALAPQVTATPTAEATATVDPNAAAATATPAAGGTAPATETAPQGTAGGGTTAPGTTDSATTDQPPPAGSNADEFESFCAENPGAC